MKALLLILLSSCSMQSVVGTWNLPGEHPATVPSVLTITPDLDGNVVSVTGDSTYYGRFYYKKGFLIRMGGNDFLGMEMIGKSLTLTDSLGGVAFYWKNNEN